MRPVQGRDIVRSFLKMGIKIPRCACIVVALVGYRFQVAYLAIIQGPTAIITCAVYRITFYVILDNVYAVRNIYNDSRNAVPFDSYMVEQFHFPLPPSLSFILYAVVNRGLAFPGSFSQTVIKLLRSSFPNCIYTTKLSAPSSLALKSVRFSSSYCSKISVASFSMSCSMYPTSKTLLSALRQVSRGTHSIFGVG